MAPAEFDDKTDNQLIEGVWGMVPQNPIAVTVDRLLRWRQAERDAEGSKAMVAATEKLVSTTEKLVAATDRLGGPSHGGSCSRMNRPGFPGDRFS